MRRRSGFLTGVGVQDSSVSRSDECRRLLNEIGEEFYALLFMHVCRFRYTMIGGMQLKLDVNAYVQWVRATVTDPRVRIEIRASLVAM